MVELNTIATRRRRGTGSRLLASALLFASTSALVLTTRASGTERHLPFVAKGAPGSMVDRRMAVLGGVLPALLGSGGALAIPRVTDRNAYLNKQKMDLVPEFKRGMDYLEKKGIDDRMLTYLPRMVRKMELYGSGFSATEAPDKIVRTLERDAEAFKVAVAEKKDVELAKQAFEKYRLDIPKGVGSFDLSKPSTYEAPPP